MVNEKLNTGYHGVKHLFTSNDFNKVGRLTRFKRLILKFSKLSRAYILHLEKDLNVFLISYVDIFQTRHGIKFFSSKF